MVAIYESRMVDIAKSVEWPALHISFEDWWQRPERNKKTLDGLVGRELDYSHFNEMLWRA